MALEANLISEKQHETLTEFQAKVDAAKMNGEEWVETTPEIIKYYNRNGLGKHSEYFIFQNIKVCLNGQGERIRTKLGTQLGVILYGAEEGRANQGSTTKPLVEV